MNPFILSYFQRLVFLHQYSQLKDKPVRKKKKKNCCSTKEKQSSRQSITPPQAVQLQHRTRRLYVGALWNRLDFDVDNLWLLVKVGLWGSVWRLFIGGRDKCGWFTYDVWHWQESQPNIFICSAITGSLSVAGSFTLNTAVCTHDHPFFSRVKGSFIG